MERYYTKLPQGDRLVVQQLLLPSLIDADAGVRRTVCNVCSTIVRESGLSAWPQLLQQVLAAVGSQQAVAAEGGLRLFMLLAKDCPMDLKEANSTAEAPLSHLVNVALQYMQGSSPTHASHAGYALCNLICVMPGALTAKMPDYLQALGFLVRGGHSKLLPVALNSFLELTEHALSAITPNIDDVMELMLQQSSSTNETARKLAAKFWGTYADATGSLAHGVQQVDPVLRALQLKPVELFPRLLPALVEGCVFDEETMMSLPMDNTSDMGEPDRPEDVVPHLAGSDGRAKPAVTIDTTGGEILDSGASPDMGSSAMDMQGSWTVRNACVTALIDLSTAFGELMWPEFFKLLQRLLQASAGETSWQSREVGIMLLGATSDGFYDCLVEESHLAGLLPFLLQRLQDPHPMVRATTGWTLKVFAETIVYGLGDPEAAAKLLRGLLTAISDPRKRVVCNALEALGCTCATMESDITEYAMEILRSLMALLPKCQLHCVRYAYDAVACVCEALGGTSVMANQEAAELVLRPLATRYVATPVADVQYLMLAECTAAAASVVGVASAPMAVELWNHAARTVQALLLDLATQEAENPQAVVDRTPISVNLDILDHLIIGLGKEIAPLLGGSEGSAGVEQAPSLLALLNPCLSERSQKVRKSAFAIVIDLVDAAVPGFVTHDTVHGLVERCVQSSTTILQASSKPGFPPTIVRKPLNNAVFALATLAKALGQEFASFAPTAMAACASCFQVLKRLPAKPLASAALLLARTASCAPTVVAPRMHEFLTGWLQAGAVNGDTEEKREIQQVFVALYSSEPAVAALFNQVPQAVIFFACSWYYPSGNEPSAEDRAQALQWLRSIAAAHGAEWKPTLQSLLAAPDTAQLANAIARCYPEVAQL